MNRARVESRAVAKIGYDSVLMILEIEYKARDGQAAVWQYQPITEQEYFSMTEGPSIGKFIGTIKRRVDAGDVRAQLVGMVPACEIHGSSEEMSEAGICGSCENAIASVG